MFKLDCSDNYEQYLLPGDIVLKYENKNPDLVAKVIKLGQKFQGSNHQHSTDYVHAGVYIGDLKYAEATHRPLGDLIAMSTKGYFTDTDEVHVFRLKDREMANNLAEIAKIIVDEVPEEKQTGKTGKYNFTKAIFSVLASPRESKKILKHYLKAGFSAHEGTQPMKKGKHRDFFCSYLVAWGMQGAEARKTIEKFNRLNKEKIEFPDLKGLPEGERDKMLSKWAKEVIKKFGRQLEALVEIDLDAKTTSPARLYDFMCDNPKLFDQVGVVYAKSGPPK